MSTVLSLFGYSCVPQPDGSVTLYKVPMNKVAQNTYVQIQQGFFTMLGIAPYSLPDDPFPYGDKRFLKIPAQCFVISKANSSHYGYSSGCVDCQSDMTFFLQGLYLSRKDMVCQSDGFAENRDTGVIPDLIAFCNKCSPPEPYYFNYTNCVNNTFIATDECYFTLRSNVSVNDVDVNSFDTTNFISQIISMGGTVVPQDSSDFVNVQCESANKPELYFFSIKIFDLKLWIYIFVAYIFIMLAYYWYSMVGVR